jgi:hypothetical protein
MEGLDPVRHRLERRSLILGKRFQGGVERVRLHPEDSWIVLTRGGKTIQS